jgi:nitroimidazol reductase NimA-like FMN-containing flavoprotein (pyridoxamine 5'-phosphate oxidase superfamily)
MAKDKYHLRFKDREMRGRREILDVIMNQNHMTIAMCRGGEPYLATVNHAYEPKLNCLYFHCARKGKKIDYLRANPTVWVQILEDRGYVQGKCDYDYRTVQIKGRATRVTNLAEKRSALRLLIKGLESEPEPSKKLLLTVKSLRRVAVFRVDIESITGKKRVP